MDLKNFKKVHEDDEKAVMKNKHGHSITIAKKSLSKKHLEGLKKLPLYEAEGDYIDPKDLDKANASDLEGNPVVKGAGATPKEHNFMDPEAQYKSPVTKTADSVKDLFVYPYHSDDTARPLANPEPNQQPIPEPAPKEPTLASAPDTSPEQPIQSLQQPTPVSPVQKQAAPKIVHPAIRDSSMTAQEHAQIVDNDLNDQVRTTLQDLQNGHIQPKTFATMYKNEGTLSKIGTLFSLLLSGAGSGLAHQPNALLEMMNKEIDRDFEAQKQTKANQISLLQRYQEQQRLNSENAFRAKQGQLTEAETKTSLANLRLIAQTKYLNQMKIGAYANLLGDVGKLPPDKQGAAAPTLNYIGNAVQQDIQQRNAKTAAQVSQNSEAAFQQRMQNYRTAGVFEPAFGKFAEEQEAHHYPGINGQSSVGLTSEDRGALGTGIQFDRKLNDFIDWTKKHSGDLSPSDRNRGETLAAELQGAYRMATHGGVYKEGEQNFISKLIDSTPTKFFNSIRVIPQLEALSQENHNRVDQTAKNLGFNGYEGYKKGGTGEIEKYDPKTKRNAIFDAETKQFKRWK